MKCVLSIADKHAAWWTRSFFIYPSVIWALRKPSQHHCEDRLYVTGFYQLHMPENEIPFGWPPKGTRTEKSKHHKKKSDTQSEVKSRWLKWSPEVQRKRKTFAERKKNSCWQDNKNNQKNSPPKTGYHPLHRGCKWCPIWLVPSGVTLGPLVRTPDRWSAPCLA